MTSHRFSVAIIALALLAPFAAGAQSSAPMASKPMAEPASGAKVKKPVRARVSGGPGYVSEGTSASSPAASSPAKRVRARVTGGPGGTAP